MGARAGQVGNLGATPRPICRWCRWSLAGSPFACEKADDGEDDYGRCDSDPSMVPPLDLTGLFDESQGIQGLPWLWNRLRTFTQDCHRRVSMSAINSSC